MQYKTDSETELTFFPSDRARFLAEILISNGTGFSKHQYVAGITQSNTRKTQEKHYRGKTFSREITTP